MSQTEDAVLVNNEVPSEEKPKLPAGIPYIIGNEAAERFSFYGMKTILMLYMTQSLLTPMSKEEATGVIHMFNFAVYFLPFFGALLADLFWGKYKVIFYLSLVYCVGHLVLALPCEAIGMTQKGALLLGLTIIALGSGGIKSCVSSFVGDQFNSSNQSLMSNIYNWFYLAINFGSFFSTLLTPWLREKYGPHVAFGVPGVLMAIATLVFWLGRKKYAKRTVSTNNFLKEIKSKEGLQAIGKVLLIYLFLVPFWAMYDQTGSRWVEQGDSMDSRIFYQCTFLPDSVRNFEILPDQMQALNPALILGLIPLFTVAVYPFINKFINLTLVRKIKFGLIIGAIAAAFPLYFEYHRQGDVIALNQSWQVLAYIIITVAEILISVSSLELAYKQAPKTMKSLIMSFYTMPIAIGNLLVGSLNMLIDKSETFACLKGTNYYMLFFVLLVIDVVGFFLISRNFQEQTILQDDEPEPAE